ncbi:MAG: DUF2490 domain-containing protein [Vicinamibacterales bacterium]
MSRLKRWRASWAAVVVLAVLCGPRVAEAQADGDRHLWLQAVAIGSAGPWRVHLEAQPRWFEDVTAPFQMLLRTAAGRQVSPSLSLWAGHGWIAKPPGPGVKHEHRLWQQMLATLPPAGVWTFSVRARQEQRWQDGWDGASHRTRLMLRAVRPLGGPRWYAALWDEGMVTWNGTGAGPVSGFDQNRLFAGVGRRFTQRVAVEGGYLWFALRPSPGVRADNHVVLVTANATF